MLPTALSGWKNAGQQEPADTTPIETSRLQKFFRAIFNFGCLKSTPSTSSENTHLLEQSEKFHTTPVYIKDYEPSSILLESRFKREGVDDPLKMDPDEALRFYAKFGDVKGIIRAYKNGGTVNTQDEGAYLVDGDEPFAHSGDYPLHLAINGGYHKAVDQILNMEADIEAKNRILSTPLHRAASHNQPDIVRKLLKEGADVTAVNKVGNTPLHCAAYGGFVEVTQLLLEYSASVTVDQENCVGFTPLTYARLVSKDLLDLITGFVESKQGASSGPESQVMSGSSQVMSGSSAPLRKSNSLSPSKRDSIYVSPQKKKIPLSGPNKASLSPDRSPTRRVYRMAWSPKRSRFSPHPSPRKNLEYRQDSPSKDSYTSYQDSPSKDSHQDPFTPSKVQHTTPDTPSSDSPRKPEDVDSPCKDFLKSLSYASTVTDTSEPSDGWENPYTSLSSPLATPPSTPSSTPIKVRDEESTVEQSSTNIVISVQA